MSKHTFFMKGGVVELDMADEVEGRQPFVGGFFILWMGVMVRLGRLKV